jgi:endonuclease/exonuclease/phosphatase family metal-dependent hydrolase
MIKRNTFLFLLLLTSAWPVFAGDTIRVMHYNLLYYDMNTSWCTSVNNNVTEKDSYLKTITSYYKPDIFTVNEMNGSVSSVDRIIENVLNDDGSTNYKRANYAGSYLVNMLYYNTNRLALKSQTYILTSPRITDVYRLYYKSDDLAKGDTIFVTCIVTHLKAGSGSSEAATRAQAALQIMSHIDKYNVDDNILFMGDFNVYTSAEEAFRSFITPTPSGVQIFDPIDAVGSWNNNSYYAPYHTQSTHTSGDCHSGGGMDDRFDFILSSKSILEGSSRTNYVKDSYWAYGQDGNRFNQSLTSPSNTTLPSHVLNALYNMSDHLPVTLKLYVDANPLMGSDVNISNSGNIRVKNPIDNSILLWSESDKAEYVEIMVTNLLGSVMIRENLTLYPNEKSSFGAAQLPSGIYIITVRGKSISFISKIIKR